MCNSNVWTVLALMFALGGCSESQQVESPKPKEISASTEQPAVPTQAMPNIPMTLGDWARGAQLFDNMGNFHRKVTTNSDDAQRYFDQGMRFLWAFNHDESTRSFAKAAELDSQCAMCYWGVALTVGPNYNMPFMAEPRAKVAWEALQQAQKYAPQSTPVEQALISALAERYRGPQPLDPSNDEPVLTAYAQAMGDVAKRFPADLDVQIMYAESMMNLHAWKLWTPDGKPMPGTKEIVATLESVLQRDPQHPGANHYYIHTMEASPHPEKALAAAERLRGMMPGAGHLQHMPAHIMQRVGRYEDASIANREGIAADRAYLAKTNPPDYYAVYYVAHNYQFLAYSAAMEGRKTEALEAAREARQVVPTEMLRMMPGMDWYVSEVYMTMIRFGLWDQILAEPPPNPDLKGLTGGYLYARAMALAAKGRVEEATTTLTQLEKLASATPADAGAGLNLARDIFAVATLVVKAKIAQAEGKTPDAISTLREAVAREDHLAYDEPADWFIPVRHQLGAELMQAGKAKEAEVVYREDLKRHPNNGWALYGLVQALKAQKKVAEAARAKKQFRETWEHADVTLTGSAF